MALATVLGLPPAVRDAGPGHASLLAQYGTPLYVVLAVVVVALVAFAVLATGSADEAGRRRDRQRKQAILVLIRLRVTLTPEQVAAEHQLDLMHANRLLEELEREGLVAATGRTPVQYRRVESKAPST